MQKDLNAAAGVVAMRTRSTPFALVLPRTAPTARAAAAPGAPVARLAFRSVLGNPAIADGAKVGDGTFAIMVGSLAFGEDDRHDDHQGDQRQRGAYPEHDDIVTEREFQSARRAHLAANAGRVLRRSPQAVRAVELSHQSFQSVQFLALRAADPPRCREASGAPDTSSGDRPS